MTNLQFNLTIKDAIMLHLLQFSKYQDEFEAPYAITQPGIADIIGIRRSHASNVIKGLKAKDYVNERTSHVENIPRKRKIYFLTQNGLDYTLKLRDNLENKNVTLIVGKGQTKILNLSEVNPYLSTQVPLVQLLKLISTEGHLEADSVFKFEKIGVATPPVAKSVNYIDNMTQPARFVGREQELKQIKEWLAAELPRIIVITGIPGIGKTTLAAKVIEDSIIESESNLFWYRFHEWDTLRATLRELGEFLSQLGRKKLKFYLEREPNIELPEAKKLLEVDLKNLNLLMVFDDLQKIMPDIQQLFSMCVELLAREENSKINIIVLSRDTVGFYDRRDVALKKFVAELELQGLDSNASKKLFELEDLEGSNFNEIYQVTEGHPLTLELIAIHMTSKNGPSSKLTLSELFKEHHDLNKYLRDEIFSTLSKPEKKLLDMISVFRYPVFSEAFFIDTTIDHECIDALVDKSLLQETTSGYDVHELIREFFYRRLTPHLIAQYHTMAARFYNSQLEERSLADAGDLIHIAQAALEAQHHYLQGGNYENAAALVVEHAEGLISKGFTEELNSILNQLKPEVIPENIWAELLIHKGHVLTVNGQWDNALDHYQNSLELCAKLGDHCGLARAHNASGAIYFHKGNLKKAMEFYKKGLEYAEAEKDDQKRAKLYSNIALVHWRNGELERARELMRKSLFLAEKLGDQQGIARSYNNLGIIYWEQQEYDDAIEAYKKSLRLSEILGDKHTITILYNNLGEAYKLKGMVKRAEEFYRKSLELSTELGFKWQIAEVYCNLGELYKGSDPEKSKEYLRSALELYTTLGAKREVEKLRRIMEN